jgi:hypothetical protein
MRELEWSPEQAVQLNMLGEKPASGTARILEVSGKRARLATDMKATAGTAVQLQWNGQMLLGEVLSSEPDGFWMEISHMLLDTAALNWQAQGWRG